MVRNDRILGANDDDCSASKRARALSGNDNVLMTMVMMIRRVMVRMMRLIMVLMMIRMIVRLQREQGHTGPDKLVQRAFVSTTGRRHLSTMQCNEQIHNTPTLVHCNTRDGISQYNLQFCIQSNRHHWTAPLVHNVMQRTTNFTSTATLLVHSTMQ